MSDFCLKQGQGMRGGTAHPHLRIYRVPPPRDLRLLTQLSSRSSGVQDQGVLRKVTGKLCHDVSPHTL